jgi:hypothetical protein
MPAQHAPAAPVGRRSTPRPRSVLLPLALAGGSVVVGVALFSARAHGDPPAPPSDGAPAGLVAFVSGSTCPPGWAPDVEAQGRLIVGAHPDEAASAVGSTVGSALADQENRVHAHAASASVTLSSKSISGANGSNDDGAQSKSYVFAADVKAGPSKLPFLQLLACKRP